MPAANRDYMRDRPGAPLESLLGLTGWIYLAGAASGGAWFVWKSIRLVQDPGPIAAFVNFKASLLQLGLLLIAAILDRLLLV